MGDEIAIVVRIRNETRSGAASVDAEFRNLRAKATREGDAAGRGLSSGISKGVKDAANTLGMLSAVGSFANLAGLAGILTSVAGAALLIPGAVSVAAASIGTLELATAGVGNALGALFKDKPKGGGGGGAASAARSSAKAIRDAVDSVNDAKHRQAQVAEDTARDVARAERDVARASVDAARDVARAKQDQARTEEDVADSIANALEQQQKATEDLDSARVQAAQTLDDLRDRVQHYANDEEGARLRVLAAYSAQRKVNHDLTSTNLEKLQATQAVKDAEERLADVQKSRAQDTAKLADEEAKGVEGSDLVVAAKERVQDATDNVAKAREDGAEREAAAAQRVSEAEEAGAERVASAKEALADTERNAARQRADAAESVADAELRLKDAQTDAALSSGAAAAGANAYADALAKLSPNAREFVEAIKELKPAWSEMQQAVQNEFFDGFAAKVKDLSSTYLPTLRDGMVGIAGAMNAMALYAADALMKPEVVADVNAILGNTKQLFDNLKPALGDFLTGFLGLAKIGSEYLPSIGTWLSNIARDFKDWVNANPEKIRGFIDNALKTLGDIAAIAGNIGRLFAEMFAGSDGGKTFLEVLRDVTGFLADHADVIKGVLLAIAAMWVVSKVAGFVNAVGGAIGKVKELGAAVRGVPPIPSGGGGGGSGSGGSGGGGDEGGTGKRKPGTTGNGKKPNRRTRVKGKLKTGLSGAASGASGLLEQDEEGNSQAGDALAGASEGLGGGDAAAGSFADSLDTASSVVGGDYGGIFAKLQRDWALAPQQFADAKQKIMDAMAPLGQWFADLWNSIIEGVRTAWTGFMDFFNGIPEWWTGLWESIATVASDWWTINVQAPFDAGIAWIVGLWNGIPGWWNGVWNSIATAVSTWWLVNVQAPIDAGVRWVVNLWNGIPGWWSGVWSSLAQIVSNWWTINITNPLNGAIAWAQGLWNGFRNYLSGIGAQISAGLSRMWDGLVGGARGAANGAIRIVNGMIGGLNRAIAGLNMINPFGQMGYVGYVPYLAKGGIASGMAIVGERGPELVNLGAGAQVHTAGDTRRMLGQGGGSGPVEVVLRIEGGNDALSSLLMRMQRTGELQLLPAS